MRCMLVAAALAAGAVMTLAAFAQQPQTPATPPPPSAAASPPSASPEAGMPERGMMRWRMRQMMMHRMMGRRDPKQACIDRLARRAGLLAYIGAKLDLTAQQRPLWDKIQSAANDEAQQERKLCEAIKPPEEETALDRLTRMEQVETTRLNGLKTALPELRQLYQELTPEQRAILDHPLRG